MGCRLWDRGGRGGFLGRCSRAGVLLSWWMGEIWYFRGAYDYCVVGGSVCFMHGAGHGGLACEGAGVGGGIHTDDL